MEVILVKIWRRKWNRICGSDGGTNFDEEGLITNLGQKSKSEMKGPDQLESSLTQLEIELIFIGWDTEMP